MCFSVASVSRLSSSLKGTVTVSEESDILHLSLKGERGKRGKNGSPGPPGPQGAPGLAVSPCVGHLFPFQ